MADLKPVFRCVFGAYWPQSLAAVKAERTGCTVFHRSIKAKNPASNGHLLLHSLIFPFYTPLHFFSFVVVVALHYQRQLITKLK
jgi:hypothetical protein